MRKIHYEKDIDLSHNLKELKSLTVDENIDYKIEEDGMRAVGSLLIKGEYNEDMRIFVENVDVDIFAGKDKIIDQRDFQLKVEHFDYINEEGNLKLTIEVGIYGVRDGEDHYVIDSIEEIEQLQRYEEPIELEETVYETKVADIPQEIRKDVGYYYMYVVDGSDTYESIAKRYNVKPSIIQSYNNHLILEAGSVVIIPYVRNDKK